MPRVPPAGPLLILSPHLDDAVLSCFALLAREEPADVVTVFTGAPDPPVTTPWVAQTGFADSTASMAARLLEDEAAFAGLPHRRSQLGLLDLDFAAAPRPSADREAIVEAVREWSRASAGGVVAAPAGAGRRRRRRLRSGDVLLHPDHLFVRDAALAAARSSEEITLLLYEELPYAFDVRADAAVRRAARGAIVMTASVDREEKARRVSAYSSQLAHISPPGHSLGDPGSIPPAERYWRL